MPVVLLRLPDHKDADNNRPLHCPDCGSQVLQSWGRVSRMVKDIENQNIQYHRYRCIACGATFREYPPGIGRAKQTQRIRDLAALACALGLSSRDVVNVFRELGVNLSRTTVWRESQRLVAMLKAGGKYETRSRYSIDRRYLPNVSSRLGVVIAINLGNGKSVILGTVDEYNPRIVKSWLESLVQDAKIDVSIMETRRLHSLVGIETEK